MTNKSIVLGSADETRQFGVRLAQAIDGQAIITVSGPLGAGKTTLAQGVARGLGIEESVTSPTFTMMNEYDSGRLPLFHLDLYRLHKTPDMAEFHFDLQMLAAELDEILHAPSVVLVEWPEYFKEYFGNLDRIDIVLDYQSAEDEIAGSVGSETARRAILCGMGANAARIVDALASRA